MDVSPGCVFWFGLCWLAIFDLFIWYLRFWFGLIALIIVLFIMLFGLRLLCLFGC